MTRNQSFYRKVIFLCAIAVLFVPISYLSAPATTKTEGGKLSQMRAEQRLSQAQLGKIDPASASMSLATLGMRGIAANLLWGRAHHYKKTENWDAFKATLNQISKLQPNFVSVWQFQAWNIAYNVSVEFDDFRHRYHWVKKGVDYLLEGIDFNRDEPLLLWDTGWFFGHKLGRADEYQQFRRLFREDDDFSANLPLDIDDMGGPDGKPDNWKVAREWFLRAQKAVDRGARLKRLSTAYWQGDQRVVDKRQTPLRGKNPLIFHSDPPKALINYAAAIEEDGYLGEIAQLAWLNAGDAWDDYGNRPLVSSYGVKIRLNDKEQAEQLAAEARDQLAQLAPGVREKLIAEKRARLTDEQRAALDTPPAALTVDQFETAREAQRLTAVTHLDVANAAPADRREQALQWAKVATDNEEQARIIERYREIVNFIYWRQRCTAEQEDNTIEARKLVLEADQAFREAKLEEARKLYEQAWDRWAVVFDRFPLLLTDVEGEIVVESVQRYEKLLGQLDEIFPPPGFQLMKLLVEHDPRFSADVTIQAPDEQTDGAESDTPGEPNPAADDAANSPSVAEESKAAEVNPPPDASEQSGSDGASGSTDETPTNKAAETMSDDETNSDEEPAGGRAPNAP